MSYLALSDPFEYLCYGSMAIINIFTLTLRGLTLTTKVNPRTVRVKGSYLAPFIAKVTNINVTEMHNHYTWEIHVTGIIKEYFETGLNVVFFLSEHVIRSKLVIQNKKVVWHVYLFDHH